MYNDNNLVIKCKKIQNQLKCIDKFLIKYYTKDNLIK